jgi:hypothetical protein
VSAPSCRDVSKKNKDRGTAHHQFVVGRVTVWKRKGVYDPVGFHLLCMTAPCRELAFFVVEGDGGEGEGLANWLCVCV